MKKTKSVFEEQRAAERFRTATAKQLRYIAVLSRRLGGCPVVVTPELTRHEATWIIQSMRQSLEQQGQLEVIHYG